MITRRKTMKLASLLVVFVLMLPASFAYSQPAPDQAVREADRAIRERVEKEMRVVPKAPEIEEEEKPEVPEGPKFFIKKIELVGVESFSPDEFRSILEQYENREVTFGELNILARQIEREYLKRGIIAACFVPPQDVKDGVVMLRVVEAKMGALEVEDHNWFDKERLTNYWNIRKGEVLSYDKLSRNLQLMSKNPDREVKAVLHAGAEPETTDVILKADTKFPIHMLATFDREGAVQTGTERLGFGIRDNNFLFVDDTAIAGYTFGRHFQSVYGFHRIPFTNFGTSLMYGHSYTKSSPKMNYEPFGINSSVRNTSVFLYQDIFNKADYLGEIYFGLDAKDKTTTQSIGTTSRDRLRILRLGANLIHKGFGGITYLYPEISQGINGLGARSNDPGGVPTTRQADNNFTKFNSGITHRRPLMWGVDGVFKFKSQIASEKLSTLEEFPMGGIDSVRGYPYGDFMADNAILASAELLIPAFFIPDNFILPYGERPLKEEITGVVFFDWAHGRRRGVLNTSTEKREATFASVGPGIRVKLFNQAVVRCEWGFVLGNKPITERAESRFHLSINFEDQLPTEIARIRKMWRSKEVEKRTVAADVGPEMQGSEESAIK